MLVRVLFFGLDILFCGLGARQILLLVVESQSHHTLAEQVGFRGTAVHPPFKHLPFALCPCWAHDAARVARGCVMSRDLQQCCGPRPLQCLMVPGGSFVHLL